jgi:hypothetical protein
MIIQLAARCLVPVTQHGTETLPRRPIQQDTLGVEGAGTSVSAFRALSSAPPLMVCANAIRVTGMGEALSTLCSAPAPLLGCARRSRQRGIPRAPPTCRHPPAVIWSQGTARAWVGLPNRVRRRTLIGDGTRKRRKTRKTIPLLHRIRVGLSNEPQQDGGWFQTPARAS